MQKKGVGKWRGNYKQVRLEANPNEVNEICFWVNLLKNCILDVSIQPDSLNINTWVSSAEFSRACLQGGQGACTRCLHTWWPPTPGFLGRRQISRLVSAQFHTWFGDGDCSSCLGWWPQEGYRQGDVVLYTLHLLAVFDTAEHGIFVNFL